MGSWVFVLMFAFRFFFFFLFYHMRYYIESASHRGYYNHAFAFTGENLKVSIADRYLLY